LAQHFSPLIRAATGIAIQADLHHGLSLNSAEVSGIFEAIAKTFKK
jgi:hypothetical protein